MRIALLADIHSNHIALNAVLNDLKTKNIGEVFFLGDYAFGGSGSVETVDIIMGYSDYPFKIIKGNKENYIEPIENNEACIFPEMRAIYNELGSARIEWLKALPAEIFVERGNKKLRLCHNPSSLRTFVVADRLDRRNNYPNSETLERLSADMAEDICIYGHYHLFMHETVNNKTFICPSAVGLPFTGDPRAQYVIIEIAENNISCESCYVEYDYIGMLNDFERKGYFSKYNNWALNTAISMFTAKNYIGTNHRET